MVFYSDFDILNSLLFCFIAWCFILNFHTAFIICSPSSFLSIQWIFWFTLSHYIMWFLKLWIVVACLSVCTHTTVFFQGLPLARCKIYDRSIKFKFSWNLYTTYRRAKIVGIFTVSFWIWLSWCVFSLFGYFFLSFRRSVQFLSELCL